MSARFSALVLALTLVRGVAAVLGAVEAARDEDAVVLEPSRPPLAPPLAIAFASFSA
jgi:hypothetical protein